MRCSAGWSSSKLAIPIFCDSKGVGPNFADWLAPDENTNKDLLATAYWSLIANMMSQMARAVGKEDDAKRYDDLVQNIRAAFQKAYIKADGTVGTGTQTSYVVALYTGMAPTSLEPLLVDKLVKDIEDPQLASIDRIPGHTLLAFHPGRSRAQRCRLSPLAERYLSLLGIHAFEGCDYLVGALEWRHRRSAMNSYNHYAFGSVIAWVYRYAAGIDTTPDSPGFKEIVIHPHLDPRMPSARAEYESVYGKIVSDWKGTPGGPFSLAVTIPANTSAQIFLPATAGTHVTEGGNVINAEAENGSYVIRVGSGSYNYEVK